MERASSELETTSTVKPRSLRDTAVRWIASSSARFRESIIYRNSVLCFCFPARLLILQTYFLLAHLRIITPFRYKPFEEKLVYLIETYFLQSGVIVLWTPF